MYTVILLWHVSGCGPLSLNQINQTRVFQAADGKDLVILTCTAFDWSTRVTDGRTKTMAKTRWMQ